MAAQWHEIKSDSLIKHSQLLCSSYETLTGKILAKGNTLEEMAENLYGTSQVILSHDGKDDPCFTYANITAQNLWEMPWSEFIGLPSKYSAEADERSQRRKLLEEVSRNGYIDNYQGIRISKSGKRFFIKDVTVWNLIKDGQKCGQAATFAEWKCL